MEEVWEYYKLIRYNIQLENVELFSMECESFNIPEGDGSISIRIGLEIRSQILDEDTAEIFLRTTLDFEDDGPFYIKIVYRGVCSQNGNLTEEEFKSQAEDQTVPLLLPYVREYVSDVITRMGYPPYYLPTMDVMQSLASNSKRSQQEE
ncbi:protein-export chaperone SecB [Paenibacillus sp. CGMCC 1.18879]|uniref:protein-export chaperone SecB n=1 Tax=Paenibacillus sp. CGMCC 1.18879 TaxID=2834466 RepID=UPI001CA7F9A8|nr:protein-export chaperone SecB [Paenibacillus sp. CGMCC 1.18879]MBY9079571.1 protein-export chaperone SecB [Paenibacillus sp. CGMCC 1.18879]